MAFSLHYTPRYAARAIIGMTSFQRSIWGAILYFISDFSIINTTSKSTFVIVCRFTLSRSNRPGHFCSNQCANSMGFSWFQRWDVAQRRSQFSESHRIDLCRLESTWAQWSWPVSDPQCSQEPRFLHNFRAISSHFLISFFLVLWSTRFSPQILIIVFHMTWPTEHHPITPFSGVLMVYIRPIIKWRW